MAGQSFLLGQATWYYRPQAIRPSVRTYAQEAAQRKASDDASTYSSPSNKSGVSSPTSSSTSHDPNQSMPDGWEDEADLSINSFSQLPHRFFGTNQHIRINEDFKEALRQILWQFRAPIRYAFAYGSGVFPQSMSSSPDPTALSPHPNPPEAVRKWQAGGSKIIDFIFGVSHTQHWHSLNIQQHPEHYSALRHAGSYAVSRVQDSIGAGVYFNPYITVNGTMIKYGVVNLDTICRDLSEWDTLYLAGRLQKPVKILRDDPRVRLANQINLMSAVRTALLMLPEKFTEQALYEKIAGLSYLGDPRMNSYYGGENPKKVSNIVGAQMPNFRQLYVPLIDNLPNVRFNDHRVPNVPGWETEQVLANVTGGAGTSLKEYDGGRDGFNMEQDMDPVKRGNMVRRLPKTFRQKLYYQYQKKFQIPGSAFDKIVDESKDEDATSFRRRQGGEFEQRIGMQDDLPEIVGRCVRNTVAWPSTSQSIKGIVTAGVGRSWKYYSEKRAKSQQKSPSKQDSEEVKEKKEQGEKKEKES